MSFRVFGSLIFLVPGIAFMSLEQESTGLTTKNSRFHALDCVRAAAMLLGVVYHAIQMNMFGPGGLTPSFLSAFLAMEYLHCFRMPLFFLISGFFCALMFEKYGLRTYLAKRWWRLFPPLVLAVLFFGSLHSYLKPPPPMGLGPLLDLWEQYGPSEPPSPLPPELIPHDLDQDGALSKAEWKNAFAQAADRPAPAHAAKETEGSGDSSPGSESPSFSNEGLDLTDFLPRIGPLAKTLLGANARYFTLGHLWFLWYLLVFATAGPFVAMAAGRLGLKSDAAPSPRSKLMEWGLFPIVLGLVSIPAIMQTRGLFGWSLGMADGIFVTFPDVLFQLQIDWPFYFLYFMAGWWLFCHRTSLPAMVRFWLPCLLAGSFCFVAALAFSRTYANQTDHPQFLALRMLGYGISALATSLLVSGTLGVFQRYLDHPRGTVRYLANTAFWIYLVHQELLPPVIRWLTPWNFSFWPMVFLSSGIATGLSLVLYELFVRRTPLVDLFGVPPSGRSSANAKPQPSAGG